MADESPKPDAQAAQPAPVAPVAPVVPVVAAPAAPAPAPVAPVSAASVPSSPVDDAADPVVEQRSVQAGEVAAHIPALASVTLAHGVYLLERLASGAWRLADEGLRLALAAAEAQRAANRASASEAFAEGIQALEDLLTHD